MPMTIESIQPLVNAATSIVVPSGLTNSVLVFLGGTHQGDFSAINYGGAAMTQIASGKSAFNEDGDIWVLLNPTPGTATLTPTLTGGSWWGGQAVILAGIAQTTTIVNAAVNSASGAAAQVNITPPGGNSLTLVAVGTEGPFSSIFAPPPAQILIANMQNSSFENAMFSYCFDKTGMPQLVGFNLTSGQRYGIAAACFVEPAAALQTEFAHQSRHWEVPNGLSRGEDTP